MIKSDRWLIEQGDSIIKPFHPNQVKFVVHSETGKTSPALSYGTSSYGYDCRLGNTFKIFTNVYNSIIDPKNFDPKGFVEVESFDPVVIPPNSFALARSHEWIKVPRDVIVLCIGKSTYARCGVIVNVTPLEPEWEGYITIEISNTATLPVRIYPLEGIMQLLFLGGDQTCLTSYADRAGKYNKQSDIVLPKV